MSQFSFSTAFLVSTENWMDMQIISTKQKMRLFYYIKWGDNRYPMRWWLVLL